MRSRNAELEVEVLRLQNLLEGSRSLEDVPERWRERLRESVEEVESLRRQLATFTKEFPMSTEHKSSTSNLQDEVSSTRDGASPTPEGTSQTLDGIPPRSHGSHRRVSENISDSSAKMRIQAVLDPLIVPSLVLGSEQFREGAQLGDSHGPDDHNLAKTFGAYPIKYEILEMRLRMPIRDDQRRSLSQPLHGLQPLNFDDFPPDDGISTVESMSSFISAFRGYANHLAAQKMPPDVVLGQTGIDVQSLFTREDFRDARTLATFVPRFVANFDLMGLKEKVAFSIIIDLVLRVRRKLRSWRVTTVKLIRADCLSFL